MSLPTRLAVALTLTVLFVVAASSQSASAAVRLPPTSPLNGTLEPDCIMVHKDTPAVRWSFINDTNGPHIFELRRNGEVAYSQVVSPGTSVTHTLVDHQKAWQGTWQTFEIVAMDKTRAYLHHHFDCRPAQLEVLDIDISLGGTCQGSAKLDLANTGGHTSQASAQVDGAQVYSEAIHGNESLTANVPVGGGQNLAILQDGEVVHQMVVSPCQEPVPDDPPIQDPPVQDPPVNEPPVNEPEDQDPEGNEMESDDAEPSGTLEEEPSETPPATAPPDQDLPELATPLSPSGSTGSSDSRSGAGPLPWLAAAALTVLVGATAAVVLRHR